MRIIHVLHSHGYGGAENHALMLMQGLRQRGHEVLYAGPEDGWLSQECETDGIPTVHLAMSGLYDLRSHFRLRRLVRAWQPDIVHGHLVRGAHYAGWAVRFPRGNGSQPRPVATVHATTAHRHMGHCDHLIAVCKAVRENLTRHGHPPEKISVIYNGIGRPPDAGDRVALRAGLGIPLGRFAVVNVGRFIHDKGQDTLVQVARLNPSLHFYFVGDFHTPFGEQVRHQAEDVPNVHFMGFRNDVPTILPAFDAYAVSSRREAFSLAIVEACAAKVPCVATRVGGIPEIIREGDTGLLVAVDAPAETAAALVKLQSDPALAASLAARAHESYLRHFTVEQMIEDTARVYRLTASAHTRI